MGSIAQDKKGNMALGYSVVNGVDVFPGIRYTGRLAGDPLGQMTLGEGTIINGTGVQTTTNSRWGDYTSMNVDPVDDCTFWYVNEYYTAAGQLASTAGWQTRIASRRGRGVPRGRAPRAAPGRVRACAAPWSPSRPLRKASPRTSPLRSSSPERRAAEGHAPELEDDPGGRLVTGVVPAYRHRSRHNSVEAR